MDDRDREAFAQVMGMKPREIAAAEVVPGGFVVTTHDHVRTFVDEHGRVGGAVPAPVSVPAPPVSEVADGPTGGEQNGEQNGPEQPAPNPNPDPDPSAGAGAGPSGDPGAVPPEGSEREVMAWVDDDPGRAAAALRAEESRETPRKGLLGRLQQLVG